MSFIPKSYTVESVTSGHPDKVCDQISDAILDGCLKQDPNSRVAMETFGGHGLIVAGGEITSKVTIDYEDIVRKTYRDIGYEHEIRVITNIVRQSPDIALGVDTGGAGDQGIMYGFATKETTEFLPKAIVLAHKLARGLENLRKLGKVTWLKPDGKTQVTIREGVIKTIVVSAQHTKEVSLGEITETLKNDLIKPLVGSIENIEILVNPTGSFIQGGFEADTGLTGRKIMVDTYGGIIPHGGGCFSGKDATKVDRSAAYMCRFVAKNIVAHGFAKECLVSVAYAIGKAEPLMVEALNEKREDIFNIVRGKFDFRPNAIIESLGLRRPIYFQTAAYGHFGREEFPWEKIINNF